MTIRLRRLLVPPISALSKRLTDANRLIEIHEEITGQDPGRRRGYDSLNRSAVMLAVAAWEGFCEDVLRQATSRLARRLKSAAQLPDSIRGPMLVWWHGKNDWGRLNEDTKKTVWALAGTGWRKVYVEYCGDKIAQLNTPNYENIKKLFANTIGISDIASNWTYRRWGKDVYLNKLSDLLDLRHRIAHGAIGEETVGKARAKDAVMLVRRLSEWISASVKINDRALGLA